MMESILDMSRPVDVAAFDNVVAVLSSGSPADIMRAQEVLSQFKAHPDAFLKVDKLLTESQLTATRFFALQILEDAILQRWNSLDAENQKAIRGFVMNLIVRECSSFQHIRNNKALLTKMNTTLVAIAKREWPVRWPNFIQDICQSASPSDPMIENNLNLLRLVGEEIFQFGEKTLTSKWITRKKESLASNFPYIMEVCGLVITGTEDTALLKVALEALEAYAPWMQPSLIMQEGLLVRLASFVVGDENVRTAALRCFTEICSIAPDAGAAGDSQVQLMLQAFRAVLNNITSALPTSHSSLMERVVQLYEGGSAVDQLFVDNLNLLLVTFLRNYYSRIAYDNELVIACHELLVGMSNVDDKELFKSCVEYWWWLGDLLVRSPASSMKKNLMTKLPRILSDVRYVLIKRMAKPEEIIIVEEDGELRRQHMADVEELELYKLMRESLVFLTNLDSKDTRSIMVNLMQRQIDHSEWSWQNCNTLSWAVGAISMSMPVEEEAELFIIIVKGLLQLCKDMKGKENRAVIASNVMFVVGQYPRYLESHPMFLFTVVRKVFEFMRETFPGVQDMAVDTFLKLSKLLSHKFVLQNQGPSFAEEIAAQWTSITSMLTPQQIQVCFSAIGCMVAADSKDHQATLLAMFLRDTNENFRIFIQNATQSNGKFCTDSTLMVELIHYLRIFSSTADTCGDAFFHEMSTIIQSLYFLYSMLSECQNLLVAQASTAVGLYSQDFKYLRLAKREVLLIFERFVTHSGQLDFVATNCMPEVFSVVLQDYQNSIPQAKEPGALALTAACVCTLGNRLSGDCAAILDHTFNTTIAMIIDNMESFPEFRVNLFKLLKALNENCFEAFVSYAAEHSDVLEGMLWAIKHKDYPTMSTGLQTLDQFLENVFDSPFAEAFYSAYIQRIFEEVLTAALDLFHAAGFPFHCSIMQKLFAVSDSVPQESPMGRIAVTQFLVSTLSVFPTLSESSIALFVERCYANYNTAADFKTIFADFLIEVRVWGAEQENKLQAEEERRLREETIPGFSSLALTTEDSTNPFLPALQQRLQQQQQISDQYHI